jgi:DNA-binding transcriptional MerR regulator
MEAWSIGELAARAGLTVRTLRHYDGIGLLRPSGRSAAGHRRYSADDVRRLHRIATLRGFGFSLPEIAALLDEPGLDARELVRRQLAQVADRLERERRLRDRLATVLRAFDGAEVPSAPALLTLIEEMTAMENTITPEEFRRLAEHRTKMAAELTPEEREEMSARRRAAMEAMTPEQLEHLRRSRPTVAG